MNSDSLDLYQEAIIEAAEQPQHTTPVIDADIETQGLNASCGDQVSLQIKLSPDGQRLMGLSWQGQGCIMSRAAAEHLAAAVSQSHPLIDDVLSYDLSQVLSWLSFETISPGRAKCVWLATQVLQQALKEFKHETTSTKT